MSATTTQRLDLDALARAIESRDSASQLAMYADDAVVSVVDRDHGPSKPLVFKGRDEIGAYLEDVFGREMTHKVERVVQDGSGAAYALACEYPDGTRVRCITVLEVSDGRISRQDGVQAWDAA
jgi:ketosteroid isomerase-like protein